MLTFPLRGDTLSDGRSAKESNGNRIYPLSYALSSMRSYPSRALSLALTLSLGVALVSSVFVWADTGVYVTVDNYFEENSFQMLVENPVGGTAQVEAAENYVETSRIIETTHRINSTVGLVSASALPNDTIYGTGEPIYTYGMKDCEVIFVTDQFLEQASSQFDVEGVLTLEKGQTLVSKQFVRYYYEVFGVTLTVNSTIDVDILQRKAADMPAPIGELGRLSIRSLEIAGIYELNTGGSLLAAGFPSILRSNYDFLHYRIPVLGIHDSIMLPADSVDASQLSEQGFFGARSFIRASAENLMSAGVESMADNLQTLKARVEEQFDVTVEGLDEILYLQHLVDTYLETMPLSLLNMPIFILALFLSVFAANTFMAARQREVSVLRSKGASPSQIYGVFIAESVLMAIISLVLGLGLSVLFAALIPSTKAFMVFDWTIYQFYLSQTVIQPQTVIAAVGICILPPLLFILAYARRAAHTEIGSTLVDSTEMMESGGESYGFTIGASTALLALVLGAIFLLPNHPLVFMIELILGTAAWFFMAYNGSRITRVGFAKLSSKASFLLGEKNRVSAGNLRMRKGRIVPLMVVLSLTLSSTIAFSVQAESFRTDLEKEISYAVGADLRVSCRPRPFSFNDTLERYPGVKKAVPVMKTWAGVGNERITLIGTDAIDYSLIGHFDPSSFNGKDPGIVLSGLDSVENGIILSEYHADRWNKSIGDTINLEVGGRLHSTPVSFTVTDMVHSAPGFGYSSAEDTPPSRLGAAFGYQTKFSGFAFTNLKYLSSETDIQVAELFLGDLVCITDQEQVLRSIRDLPGVGATTPEQFNLKSYSFGTALFLNTVEGLFSIGFAMSLTLSLFAMSLFLSSIVRERKKDYAILRALGASKRQVTKIVLSEFTGVVLASLALSLVLGTVFGYVMSTLVFSMSPFSRILQAAIVFPIGFLTGVLLLEIFIMILAAYMPARDASKIDPAVVLRNL